MTFKNSTKKVKSEAGKIDKSVFVCKECGSQEIEVQAFINANTLKFSGELDIKMINDDETWCIPCEEATGIITREEFDSLKDDKPLIKIEP